MLPFVAPIDFKQNPTEPIVPLPNAPQAQSKLGQIMAGIYQGAVKPTVEFMESPVGFGTLGVGAVPKLVQKGVAGLFAPVAFKNMEEARQRANEVATDPNASLQDRVTPIADAVSQGLMGIGAARHAIPKPNLGRLGIAPDAFLKEYYFSQHPMEAPLDPAKVRAAALGNDLPLEELPKFSELEATRQRIANSSPSPNGLKLMQTYYDMFGETPLDPAKLAEASEYAGIPLPHPDQISASARQLLGRAFSEESNRAVRTYNIGQDEAMYGTGGRYDMGTGNAIADSAFTSSNQAYSRLDRLQALLDGLSQSKGNSPVASLFQQ